MSAFGTKLHELLAKLKGGEELAQHEVETLVNEFLTHVSPIMEELRTEVTTELAKAVAAIREDLRTALDAIGLGLAKADQPPVADAPQGDSSDPAPVGDAAPAAPAETPAQPAE